MEAQAFVNNVEWRTTPLPRAARSLKLVRVDPHQPLSGWWASIQVVRMLKHWDGRDSWPHFKQKDHCPGCRAGHPLKEMGYGLFLMEGKPKLVVVELTQGCMAGDVLLDASLTPSIRGRYCTLTRRQPAKGHARKQSPLDCTWGPKPAPRQLPPDFDFRPTLGLIFGLIPDQNGYTRIAEMEGGKA